MMVETQALGQAYRTLRLRRGLTIKQVQGQLHASAVSHFERGDNQDIKVANLMQLLAPTMMAVDEFSAWAAAPAMATGVMAQARQAYDALDVARVQALLAPWASAGRDEPPRYLIKLMLGDVLAEMQGQPVALSPSDAAWVQSYLLQPGPWFIFEYSVFANLAYALPQSANDRLLTKMLAAYQEFHLPDYTEYLLRALYNLAVGALEQHALAAVQRLLDAIATIPEADQTLYMKQHVAFLRLVLARLAQPTDAQAQAQMAEFLRVTQLIDATLAGKDRDWLATLGVPTP